MNGWESAVAELFLLSATLFILLIDVFLQRDSRVLSYLLTQMALLVSAVLVVGELSPSTALVLDNHASIDYLGGVLKLALLCFSIAALVYARKYLLDHDEWQGEFFVLMLTAILGAMVLISASSLVMVYLGIELMSLPFYALLAMRRTDQRSAEAATKYFILGAVSSALLLYGFSLLYGLTGELGFKGLSLAIDSLDSLALLFTLTFIVAGVAFKFAAVPFHMWMPDVYQGAPTSLALCLSYIPKLAVAALSIRLFHHLFSDLTPQWSQLFIMLAVLSLVMGNLGALVQNNLKRLLAYSAIAHMGFVLLGLATGEGSGQSAALFYVISYSLMSIGAFAVLIILGRQDGFDIENMSDLKGLSTRSPWLAFLTLMILFSMIGLPPFIGFYAKLNVLNALLEAQLFWVAIVAVLMSVVGAFYYLRLIKLMYFDEPAYTLPISSELDFRIVISLNAGLVLLLGLYPDLLLKLCSEAVMLGNAGYL